MKSNYFLYKELYHKKLLPFLDNVGEIYETGSVQRRHANSTVIFFLKLGTVIKRINHFYEKCYWKSTWTFTYKTISLLVI